MITSIKNYIITFIDKDGNEQVIDSNCYMNKTLADKPLYVSKENAKKSLTRIKNRLKSEELVRRLKYWHDESLKISDYSSMDIYDRLSISNYLNVLHINENDTLRIREVNIEINMNYII